MRGKVMLGATLLDRHFGEEGWALKINLNILDSATAYYDVLGQLFDEYGEGLETLGAYNHEPEEDVQHLEPDEAFSIEYGFDHVNAYETDRGASSDDYEELDELWKDEIKALLR